MRKLEIFANSALARARFVLAAVALAAVAISLATIVFGEGQSNIIVAFLLVAISGMGLWFIARGHQVARWSLITAFALLGIVCAVAGLIALVIDRTHPQTSQSIMQTWAIIVVALLFIGAAAVLFTSDAVDELCGGRRLSSGSSMWDSVSAPESMSALPKVRSLPDRAQLLFLRRWGKVGGWISIGVALVAWIGFLIAVVWLWSEGVKELSAGSQTRSSGGLLAFLAVFSYIASVIAYVGYLIAAYLLLSVAALLAVLPIALPVALKWKDPARFLILRPFNRAHLSRPLRQILCCEISPLGHCYTLADADIRVPLWLRLPVLLGQLSFFVFRQRKIVAPNDISKLARAMKRRLLRNFNWCVSQDKVFPVACVDPGWRACVTRLVAECDCVVMDLTGLSESILWELELLQRAQALERTVFLVAADQYCHVQAALDRLLNGASAVPQPLSYDAHGLLESHALAAAATNVLAASGTSTNQER
jgi:hypothetical protein